MNKRISVWIMNGVMNAGGTESLIMSMFKYSSGKINYTLVIHCKEGNPIEGMWDKEIKKLGIPIYYLPSVGSVGVRKYMKEFQKLVYEIGRPDIVHSHINAVGGIISMAAKRAGISHRIVHCHAAITYQGTFKQRFIGKLKLIIMKKYICKYATSEWACSYDAAKSLFFHPKDTVIIPNMIPVDKYLCNEEKHKIEKDKLKIGDNNSIIIGAVGRISRIKNYELILQVVSTLKELGEKVNFVCYGRLQDNEYFNQINKMVTTLNISDCVFFKGNSSNISNCIAAFDIFVMPSISEGFGIAALEAQAAGLPTFVSDGVPQSVDLGLNLVKFLPKKDINAWVNEIKKCKYVRISDEKIIKAFNKHGYNACKGILRIEKEYEKIFLKTDK